MAYKRNEHHARDERIDPALPVRDWNRATDMRVESAASPIGILDDPFARRLAGCTTFTGNGV